jgi:hypothetical protein
MKTRLCRSIQAWLGVALCAGAAHAGTPHIARVDQRMTSLSIPFEANTGQQDKRVAFVARTFAGTLFVTRKAQIVYGLAGRRLATRIGRNGVHQRGPGWVLSESLVDARPTVRAGTPSATHVSRFIGNDPAIWQSSVPTYDRVALGEAWPGIDVQLAAHGGSVEKLFTVRAGADARRIAVRLDGAEHLALARNGALIARTGNGPVMFSAPRAWQDIKGERRAVHVAYALAGKTYSFRLGGHDRAYPVVIDPLLQSTYFGGDTSAEIYALAVDGSDNVFAAGFSQNDGYTVFNGYQTGYGGGPGDVVVYKLNNTLTSIMAATYLGGTGNEDGNAIVLDSGGNVYVAGKTSSTNFPASGSLSGGMDGFVSKLSNNLASLLGSTYLGGSGSDQANAIALDTSGNVIVAGDTTSTDFPATAGAAQPANAGSGDVFVAKLTGNLGTLVRATYLGGAGADYGAAIALDPANDVFVAGMSGSGAGFPGLAGGAQSVSAGTPDAFVAKLDGNLSVLFRSSLISGGGQDQATAVAFYAPDNTVFVAGTTTSHDLPGVSGSAAQQVNNGYNDAFVASLDSGLTAFNQVTYVGGGFDLAGGMIVDPQGDVFVTGFTNSANFPATATGIQPTFGGGAFDAFVTRLNKTLTSFVQSTYLGGLHEDRGSALVFDSAGHVFVGGLTSSFNFPGVFGGAQGFYSGGGYNQGFVSELTHGLHDPAHATANNDGDPHMKTIDGASLDFQGAGEYVALRDSGGAQIQTRQTAVQTALASPITDPYDGISSCVSVNTAVAARAGTHRVTLQPSFVAYANPAGLQVRIDGVVTALGPFGINLGAGDRVVPAPVGGGMEIDFADGTVLIATPTWWPYESLWYLNVDVFHVDSAAGLLGPLAHGSWLPALPDGSSVGPMPATVAQRYTVLYGTFGNAWRVSDASTLFDYAPGTSTHTFTHLNWPSTASCRLPRSPIAPAKPLDFATAQQACHGVTDPTVNRNCIADVMVTGEKGFAKAHLVTQQLEIGATATTVRHLVDLRTQKRVLVYIATVVPIGAKAKGLPQGKVQFLLDGQAVRAEARIDKNGQARWETSALALPGHDIVASYVPGKASTFLPSSGLDAGSHR